MTTLTRTLGPEDEALARLPRDDLVAEVPDGPDRFAARGGPFSSYERTLATDADGTTVETIRYELAPVVWSWLLGHPYRMALGRRPRHGHRPWWSPPEAPDARGSTALGAICYLGLVFGFIGTLLTQTITFAADEFDASKTEQGAVLSLVRIGVLGALGGHDPRRPARAAPRGPRLCGDRVCGGRAVRARPRPHHPRRGADRRAGLRHRRRGARRHRGRRGDALGLARLRPVAARRRRRPGRRPLPHGPPAGRHGHGRLAARDGRGAAAAAGHRPGCPAPPREPPLRRRPRRGGHGGSRLAASGCSRPPRCCWRCSPRRRRSCSTSSCATRRASPRSRSRSSASSPTPPAGSGW